MQFKGHAAPVSGASNVLKASTTAPGCSIATVVGPLIIVALGIVKPSIFWVAAAVLIAACLPLFLAVKLSVVGKKLSNKTSNKFYLNQLLLF